MGEDPEQLEREIEATRAKLGADIDALEEKVNPKKVAHRSVDSAKEKVVGVKDKVVGKATEAKDKVAAKAAETKDTVAAKAADSKDTVAGTAADAKDKVTPSSSGGSPSDGGGLGERVSGRSPPAR